MMTDNTQRTQVGLGFWLGWLLASTVVMALGVTVGGVAIFLGAAFGGVFGTLLGFAQRLVLRRQVSWSGRWVLFSTRGGAASFALAVAIIIIFAPYQSGGTFMSLGSFESEFWPATVLGIVIVIGAALGIGQRFVLRREVSRSGLWVLASAAGPALIYLVFLLVTMFTLDRVEGFSEVKRFRSTRGMDGITTYTTSTHDDPQKVIGWAVLMGVVGAVLGYGAITGGVLVSALRQPEELVLRLTLDRRTRTWLLLAAVILIALMAGYFVFKAIKANNETIRANNIISWLQVPPCSEVYVAHYRDRRVTTCHIKRADCFSNQCYDAPSDESRSFLLIAAFPVDNYQGECLLVTGEATMHEDMPSIVAYDQSDVKICQ